VLVSHSSAIAASCPSSTALAITTLRLNNFRNYQSLDLRFADEPVAVVLVGPNGAGKTNMLEALSLLAPGRGLRRAKSDVLPRRGAGKPSDGMAMTPAWSVSAQLITDDAPLSLGTGTLPQDHGEVGRRVIKINGEFSSQAALAEHLAVSWLTPDMDGVLAAAPSERRRFLDRLVIAFDPAHAGRIQRYEKAYRQRNRLLEENHRDQQWFEALEAQLAESGIAIIAARQSLVEALDAEAASPWPAFPAARLRLEGDAEDWLATMPAVDAEDRIRGEARRHRLNGSAAMPGPMNSLLVVRHSGTGQDAELSSTGEQKALVISVILAHARLQSKRLKRPPLLLLDDIVSHLDEARRRSLFDLTASLSGQVWFSGTDAALFADMPGHPSFVFVDAGEAKAEPFFPAAVRSS